MKVYKIDESGNYIGVHECQKCPETGGWLYPSNYTEIEPPEVNEFQVVKFQSGKWKISETNIGKTIYSKENAQQKICESEDIPEDFTLLEPIKDYPNKWKADKWIVDIEKYKEFKLQEIASSFNNELSNGKFFSEALQIDVDCRRTGLKNDLQNVEGLIADFDNLLPEEKYYVGLNQITTEQFTLTQLEALKLEMVQYGRQLYKKKWLLENQIKNTDDLEILKEINWNEE